MAGYHCLMPTAFLPLRHNTKSNAYGISFIKNKNTFCRISEFDNMEPNICNAQLQMMPTAFHPLNPNPFIHYYHGGLPQLLLGNDIGFDL